MTTYIDRYGLPGFRLWVLILPELESVEMIRHFHIEQGLTPLIDFSNSNYNLCIKL